VTYERTSARRSHSPVEASILDGPFFSRIGDGVEDAPEVLAALGFTDEELERLPVLYPEPTSVWRAPIPHFTPWDCNWPFDLADDASYPPDEGAEAPPIDGCGANIKGTIIGCDNRTVAEEIPIAGTGLNLRYQSDRVPASVDHRRIRVLLTRDPRSGSPRTRHSTSVVVRIAGRTLTAGNNQSVEAPPGSGRRYVDILWDGLDWSGQPVVVPQTAEVQICHHYVVQPLVMGPRNLDALASQSAVFGRNGAARSLAGNRSEMQASLCTTYETARAYGNGALDTRTVYGLGGLAIDAVHRRDLRDGIILGNGQRSSSGVTARLWTVAGSPGGEALWTYQDRTGDDPRSIDLGNVTAVATSPDGRVFFAAGHQSNEASPLSIYSIERSGLLRKVAGSSRLAGTNCSEDGVPAIGAMIGRPTRMVFDELGNLYLNGCPNVLRRITPEGVLQRVAGTGLPPSGAASFPSDSAAGEARDPREVSVAVDDIAIWDGTLVILDRTIGRVRQIEPGGTIRTILGGGGDASAPTLFGAVQTGGVVSWRLHPESVRGIQSIAVVGDRLWFIARSQLFELTAGGEVRALSGTEWDSTSTDVPEDSSMERFPRSFEGLAGGDSVTTISADPLGERVVVSVASGFGRTWLWLVEGGHLHRLDGDGPPPSRPLEGARGNAIRLDGTQGAIHWGSGGRLLRVNRRGSAAHIEQLLLWQTAGRLALPGGELEAEFDARGRHVATFDARTGVEQLRVLYDPASGFPNRLVADGQTLLEIVRSGSDARLIRPAPYDTETLIQWNDEGWVTGVSYPDAPSAGETAFSYSPDAQRARQGMVHQITDTEGLVHELEFDGFGVLRNDVLKSGEGAELRRWDLAAVEGTVTVDGVECARREVTITGEGNADRARSYERVVCDDFERRRAEGPDGSFSQVETRGRHSTTTDSTGTVVTHSTAPHPLLGGDYVAEATIRLPSGRSTTRRTEVEATADPTTGALVTERVRATSTSGTTTTLFERTAHGSEVETVSAAGRRTLTRFDGEGRVVWSAVTDAAGQPLFHPHEIEYDTLGRVRALLQRPEDRDPDVTRQTLIGYMEESTDRGWLRSVSTATGEGASFSVAFRRDALGRANRVTVGAQTTEFDFDGMSRINRVTPPDRETHESTYSHDGLLQSYSPPPTTDPTTGTSVSSLQSWEPGAHRGELARYSVTDGTTTRESVPDYDSSGRLESMTITGVPDDVTFSYAPRAGESVSDTGQLRHASMPQTRAGSLAIETTLFYDGPLGTETRTESSPGGEPDAEALPNAPWRVGYHHDAANELRLAHLTVAVGSTSMNVPTIAYDYDADGLITALGYGYDLDGIAPLEGSYDERAVPNPALARSMAVVPDPQTGVLAQTCVGGTVALGSGTCSGRVSTTITPNDFGEPASVETTWNGSSVSGSLSFHYEHDRAGRIVARTEVEGASSTTLEYGYDPQGRLENVWRRTSPTTRERLYHYQYDANGNRIGWALPSGTCNPTVSTCTRVDEQDRLLSAGGVSYRYDLQGQLATRTEGTRAETFTYDMVGNLRRVVVREGATQTRHVEYAIDAFGRRVGRYVGTSGATSPDRFWVYQDGLNPVAQLNAMGQLELLFLYGTQAHVPDLVVEVRGAGAADDLVYRVVTDQVGSVRRLVNVETGAVAASFDYSPFGVLEREDGALAARFPFRFAGGLWDGDTGLVRFGARDYDPGVGRWTAKDPILWGGGQANLYEYAGSSPVVFVDISGQHPILYYLVFGLAIGAGSDAGGDSNGSLGLVMLPFASLVATPAAAAYGMSFLGMKSDAGGEGNGQPAMLLGGLGGRMLATSCPAAPPTSGERLAALGYDGNKLNHVFAPKHMMDSLVQRFGSQEEALLAVHRAAQGISGSYVNGSWVTMMVGGLPVSIKGAVVDGVFRIGTMTMKPF
jgi:RHS repeat-associated protein